MAALAGVEPGLVPSGPLTHLLDVGLGLGELALGVAGHGLRPHEVVAHGADLLLELGELGVLGQRALAVRDLLHPGVDALHVEQAPLVGRRGLQGVLPLLGTCMVQGSVRVVLTRVSTVLPASPRAATILLSQPASHGHSLAQCETSTR